MNPTGLIHRRHFLGLLAAAALAPAVAAPARAAGLVSAELRGSIGATELGLRPGAIDDQSIALQNALNTAAELDRTLFLEPGTYYLSNILLPRRTRLAGISGETRLVYSGAGHLLVADRADLVQLTDLVLDGANRELGSYAPGIVHLIDVPDIHVGGCRFTGSAGSALVADRCGGRIAGNDFAGAADAGLSATESTGLSVTDNTVAGCGNNGIVITRWRAGDDGTLVIGNRIERVRADAGDTGPNGNAIKVFQAHGVTIAQNRIADCAFAAVRANGADNIQIVGNNCARLGETAISCAMGFEGAVIADNVVDGAANGITVSNSTDGGRIAAVSGNVVRNINAAGPYPADAPGFGIGLRIEADTAVTGNVIDRAARAGMWIGWGPSLRDVAVTGNVIREAPIGIAVSVIEGVGATIIADNLISAASEGAVVGMRWADRATGDLTLADAPRYNWINVGENLVTG
jgi:uncharacterized secreted repeat protein (TIGR03808 family)